MSSSSGLDGGGGNGGDGGDGCIKYFSSTFQFKLLAVAEGTWCHVKYLEPMEGLQAFKPPCQSSSSHPCLELLTSSVRHVSMGINCVFFKRRQIVPNL